MKKLPENFDYACIGISFGTQLGKNKLVYDAEVIVDLIMTSSERSEGQAWEYFWDEFAPEYSNFAIFMIPGDIEIIMSEWDDA